MDLRKIWQNKAKRDWGKLHITLDHHHIIQSSELTDRKIQDMEVINNLILPIKNKVNQVTADTAYDANKIYQLLQNTFYNVDIVIPPKKALSIIKKVMDAQSQY